MLRKSPEEIEKKFVLPNTDKQALAPDQQLQMLRKSREQIQQHFVFPNIEKQPHTPHQQLQMLTQPQARSSSIVLCQTQTNSFSHQTSSYNCSESHTNNSSSILSFQTHRTPSHTAPRATDDHQVTRKNQAALCPFTQVETTSH